MALTISKLKMWKDPKYTQGCIEVPPAGSWKMPAADYTLAAGETLRPHKGSTLTSLELPLSFTKLFPMSYLYIEASDGNGSVKLFGWIDSVTQIATSAEAVRIDWSVDWWRSFSGSATFGMGLITRCASSTYKRPRTLSPRYKKKAAETPLFPITASTTTTGERSQLWVIVLVHETAMTMNGGNVESSRTQMVGYFWPAPLNNPSILPPKLIYDTGNSTAYKTVSVTQAYNGQVDEMIAAFYQSRTTATAAYNYEIIAGYVSPVCPSKDAAWDNTNGYWYEVGLAPNYSVEHVGSLGFFVRIYGDGELVNQYTKTFTTFTPDDTAFYSVVDFDGNLIGNLPWGIDITGVIAETNIGTTGAYLNLRFTSSILGSADTMAGSATGLMFSVPLPALPVSSNYWSDYVLSGQREFNRLNREYAREEEAWKSGVNETKNAIDTAISINPEDWLTAIVQSTTGFAAIGANLMINEEFADKYSKLDDMSAARQKNTIQESAYSLNWLYHGVQNSTVNAAYTTGPWLIKMEMDSVSAGEYTSEITTMGYEVQIPAASISSFVTAGGPLKSLNTVITGNIPPQAKKAIKTMLENGIRIVENNPSGVVP